MSKHRVEAARYTVLRRFMPAICHEIVGTLHRRLLNTTNPNSLLEQTDKIRHLTSVAIRSCCNQSSASWALTSNLPSS